jgi:hypothetical protein
MTFTETLAELRRIGAKLEAVEGRSRCSAPWGSISPELRLAIPEQLDPILRAIGTPKVPKVCRMFFNHIRHS